MTFVLNYRHLAVWVDLLHIPVWLYLQMNTDLLKGNTFSVGNQTSPL